MKETLKSHGLLLYGNSFVNNFVFERPFALWGGCKVQNCVGGGYSYINANSVLENTIIGRYSCVAHNVTIGALRHDSTSVAMTSVKVFVDEGVGATCEPIAEPFELHDIRHDIRPQQTIIANGVWVGANAFFPAAHELSVGNGAIIAACAVVTKPVPAYAVVAGNPAKVVKMRFKGEIIADLESSKWWEYDWPLATARLGIKAPFSDAKDFCAWWADGGAELLAPFRLEAKLARIRQDENGAFLDRLNYNFDNIF